MHRFIRFLMLIGVLLTMAVGCQSQFTNVVVGDNNQNGNSANGNSAMGTVGVGIGGFDASVTFDAESPAFHNFCGELDLPAPATDAGSAYYADGHGAPGGDPGHCFGTNLLPDEVAQYCNTFDYGRRCYHVCITPPCARKASSSGNSTSSFVSTRATRACLRTSCDLSDCSPDVTFGSGRGACLPIDRVDHQYSYYIQRNMCEFNGFDVIFEMPDSAHAPGNRIQLLGSNQNGHALEYNGQISVFEVLYDGRQVPITPEEVAFIPTYSGTMSAFRNGGFFHTPGDIGATCGQCPADPEMRDGDGRCYRCDNLTNDNCTYTEGDPLILQ